MEGGGIGLGTLLTIIFMVLKLCGVITWPWILVCLPVIIGGGISLIVGGVTLFVLWHFRDKLF